MGNLLRLRGALSGLGLGQLGPDSEPVFRAQLLPGDLSLGGLLNLHGKLGAAGAVSVRHVAQMTDAGSAQRGKRLPLFSRQLAKVVDELHTLNYTLLRHSMSTQIGDINMIPFGL